MPEMNTLQYIPGFDLTGCDSWFTMTIWIFMTKFFVVMSVTNRLHCSCFILFPAVHTSLLTFHLISLSPHFIDHVSLLFPSVHSPSHLFHLPQSILFMLTLFGCIHITWSFNLIISFTFQPITFLEINDLWVSLNKFLILDRYSLLEAELRWFYYSLSPYIKQEIQHGVRSGILVCSATDVYLSIYSTQAYVGTR